MIKKTGIIAVLSIFIWLFSYNETYTWGFFAHKKINRLSTLTLPDKLIGFYKENIEFITEHAVDPDKRRYSVEGEAPRHYIDIDHYTTYSHDKSNVGKNPFELMPRKWEDATKKYSEDTLMAYGIVPWYIPIMVDKLTYAFKKEDFDRILKYSSELGHYVGDSHVPLHTTENYNGQLTGQKGIHGFWESRLPELEYETYDFLVGRAYYIDDVLNTAWNTVEASHAALDSVLSFEAKLNEEFPSDKKYGIETRGAMTIKTYSRDYSEAYHKMMDGMVERRMRESVIIAGSLWYTAWVNAGKPDLSKLLGKKPSSDFEEELRKEEEQYNNNRGKKIKNDHEE